MTTNDAAPAPDTVEQIMALADEYARFGDWEDGRPVEADDNERAALRAAVERVVRDKTQAEAAAEWNRELYEAAKARADLDTATAKLLETKLERAEREAAELREDLKAAQGFGDLWYFAMDEAPMEFENIVTTCSPSIWMSEIAKIRAARKENGNG